MNAQARAKENIFFIAGVWMMFIAQIRSILSNGWREAWHFLNVPARGTLFFDLRGFPNAIAMQDAGSDPFTERVMPFKYPLNYPRFLIWVMRELGIDEHNLVYFGAASAVLFLLALSVLIYRAQSRAEGIMLVLAAFCASSLLAIERGNTDMLMFVLVEAACLTGVAWAFALMVFLAANLKMFPVFALVPPLLIVRYWRMCACALIVFAVICMCLWEDIANMAHATPVGWNLAYGALALKKALWGLLMQQGVGHEQARWLSHVAYALFLLSLAGVFVVGWYRRLTLVMSERDVLLFLSFAAMFGGTYAFGANWNYRLIFLIPLIPFFVRLYLQEKNQLVLHALVALNISLHFFTFERFGSEPLGWCAEGVILYLIVFFGAGVIRNVSRSSKGASWKAITG